MSNSCGYHPIAHFDPPMKVFNGGKPEPEVSVDGRPFTISAVCNFVSKFGDLMPAKRWDLLAGVSRGGDKY
jgi:hypothetical protein